MTSTLYRPKSETGERQYREQPTSRCLRYEFNCDCDYTPLVQVAERIKRYIPISTAPPKRWNTNIDATLDIEIESIPKVSKNTDENTPFGLGDKVSCREYENESGYDGVIMDIRGDKALIKITKVIVNGFFSNALSPSTCNGNIRLYGPGREYGEEGEGSLIWVPLSCIY